MLGSHYSVQNSHVLLHLCFVQNSDFNFFCWHAESYYFLKWFVWNLRKKTFGISLWMPRLYQLMFTWEEFFTCTCFPLVLFIAWLYLIETSKKQNKNKERKKNLPPTSTCASLCKLRKKFTGNNQSLEGVHTGFAGAWHAHLCDGGENGVVQSALADQVNYPVCDLLDGASVQLVVFHRLQVLRKRKLADVCWFRLKL